MPLSLCSIFCKLLILTYFLRNFFVCFILSFFGICHLNNIFLSFLFPRTLSNFVSSVSSSLFHESIHISVVALILLFNVLPSVSLIKVFHESLLRAFLLVPLFFLFHFIDLTQCLMIFGCLFLFRENEETEWPTGNGGCRGGSCHQDTLCFGLGDRLGGGHPKGSCTWVTNPTQATIVLPGVFLQFL